MMRVLHLPAAVIGLVAAAAELSAGAPFIAEFQADNRSTIADEDGSYSDWLEIHNPDATAVNLGGMALTDDSLIPQKWMLPAVPLAPKSTLLIWCSGKNRTIPEAPLHTSFQLAREGGYLALMAADGTTKLSEWNPYPGQAEDRSYGISSTTVAETVIPAGAPCRWLVPSAAVNGWETRNFVDTAWTAAVTGIGYDRSAADGDYLPLLGAGGNTEARMFNLRTTCYIRIPFNIAAADIVQTLLLRVKYEDGFAAFLNGTRLNPPAAAQTNAPAVLTFSSGASAVRSNAAAVVFQNFDLTAQKSALVSGSNVLAVQLLNQAASSSDLLFVPELSLTKTDPSIPPDTGYFAAPTPGINNSSSTVDGFVDAPDFSVKRGFYPGPVSVELSTHTPGAQIRYTTSGSPPTSSTGTLYTNPVTISASSVLRAAAFIPGWEPSTIKSHSYIFPSQVPGQPAAPAGFPATWGNAYNFASGTLTGPVVPADYGMDPSVTQDAVYGPLLTPALTTTLPIVSLSGDIAEIFGFAGGIYSNGRLTPGIELASSMEFWNPAGSENWQENIGLRMHGGDAPLEHPKKPFRIYFRKEYGAGRLRQPLFPGSPVDSFDKLQLRPGGHDGWAVPFGSDSESLASHASYCRDRFLRQTELDMGRLAHRGRYVHLFINGLYWGFYDLHEVQSKEMFADHRGGAEEEWDVVEQTGAANPLFDVVDGTAEAMDTALALVRPAAGLSTRASYDQLAQYIDYNEFIDNLIVQMWGGQNDWMGPVFRGIPGINLTDASRFFNKNWQAARRSRGTDPTGFLWQTWDAEISMGNSLTGLVSRMRVTDFNHTLIGTPDTEIPRVAGTPGPAAEIYYALRKYNPQFRMQFADRLQKHFFNNGAMTVASNQARMQSFRDELDLPVVLESARWGDVNTGNPVRVTFTRNDHWRQEMDWLQNTYIPRRNNTLLSQFRAIGLWPGVKAPALDLNGGTVASGFRLTVTDPNGAGGVVYYTLDGTDPMAGIPDAIVIPLATPASICRYKVPASQYVSPDGGNSNTWKSVIPPDDIASWQTGPAALGFGANSTFTPHISTAVGGMQGINTSVYMRIPFTVTAEQKAAMTSLTLRLKYDDGAFVFLNGSLPLHRLNAPTTSPAFNAKALTNRASADAASYQTLDLTAQIPALATASENILAIQGLNYDNPAAAGLEDADFLCAPELTATATVTSAPSAAAATYVSGITLSRSGTVKARVFKDGVWSPLSEASFIVGVPADASNLTITEFSYNPAASPAEISAGFTGQQFEFVELMNISASPVELAGCRFDDGISFDFASSAGQTLEPGQRIVMVSDAAAFAARHPGVPVAGVFAGGSNLSNAGERLELLNAAGAAIFDFVYNDAAPWPASPDGRGSTLVLINPDQDPEPGDPVNWRSSMAQGGAPGAADADSFAAWAARNSVAGNPHDDPNSNGLTNLAEYGLGLHSGPGAENGITAAGFETVDTAGGPETYLVVRFHRNTGADDVAVTPEMSTDLISWIPLADEVSPAVSNSDGTESLTRRSPLPVASGRRVFVRVSVSTR